MQHPDLSQDKTKEFTVYLVITLKGDEQAMAPLFLERAPALYFFCKTLMSALTHQLLAIDMHFLLSAAFHVAIRFVSLMTFRGYKPNF